MDSNCSYSIIFPHYTILWTTQKNAVSSNLTSSSNNIGRGGGQGIKNEIHLKITSPQRDQQVPVGQLTISGTSTDNPTTDCQVFADVNDIKPLQNATATGPGGVSDYSTWQFTYTEAYELIKEGVNELTSKLTCISKLVLVILLLI